MPTPTPISAANQAIEWERPGNSFERETQERIAGIEPRRRTGVPFQSGGGRFYTKAMMGSLRHTEVVLNSMVKRGELDYARPLFYGDAW
jgi:hypothetical protein